MGVCTSSNNKKKPQSKENQSNQLPMQQINTPTKVPNQNNNTISPKFQSNYSESENIPSQEDIKQQLADYGHNKKRNDDKIQITKEWQSSNHPLFNSGLICQKNEDDVDQNSQILYKSGKEVIPPFSNLSQDYILNPKIFTYAPPPLYLALQDISNKRGCTKHDLLYGLELTEFNEAKLVDSEILNKFKGIFSDLAQKVFESVSAGRGIVGVSLPVRIFEPRSLLERACDSWAFAPIYLNQAVTTQDPILRMKNVVCFAFAGISQNLSQLKPFNPILGETYQAEFKDGTPIFLEHTSHHPPISNFFIDGKGYKYYGRYEYVAKTSYTLNTINVKQEGINTVEFQDGTKIQWQQPRIKLKGIMMGDRTNKITGHIKFTDQKNNLSALIYFGKNKKSYWGHSYCDQVKGKLYKMKKNYNQVEKSVWKDQEKEDTLMKDLEQIICEIDGSWLTNLNFGSEELWNINEQLAERSQPILNPLPSDSRYREDLIWLKRNDQPKAEKWKLMLEDRQRANKKLRDTKNPSKSH